MKKHIPHIALGVAVAFGVWCVIPRSSAQGSQPQGQQLPPGVKIYYYHHDHLGSVNMVTDETGQVVQRMEYKPFGEPYLIEGQDVSPHKFTGKRLDASTGLYYFNARYYDAQLGRFIQPDTIVPNPGNPQDLNRYTYGRNNPLKYTDPTGRKPFWRKVKHFFAHVIDPYHWYIRHEGAKPYNPYTDPLGTKDPLQNPQAAYQAYGTSAGLVVGTFALAQMFIGFGSYAFGRFGGPIRVVGAGGVLGDEDVFGAHGGRLFIPGIGTSFGDILNDASKYNRAVFENPTYGFIPDAVEYLLGKVLPFGAEERRLAALLRRAEGKVDLQGHSQGAQVLANALILLGLSGHRLPEGSRVEFVGPAVSQPKAALAVTLSGASKWDYQANNRDLVNPVAPNLNPVKFFGGVFGGLSSGAKYHAYDQYSSQDND